MKKKLIFGLLFITGSFAIQTQAQSVDNAKKKFEYERFKTAQTELEKIVAATPGNADAQYWLVQTLLQQNNKAGARKVADAALASTNNNPLALVAIGQVDLFDNKKQEARNRFESAISAADKKSLANILNAVGRAHGIVGISQSDPDYAIEKLKLAQQKDPKNADILVNIGNNFRRKLDGGNAVVNYTNALALDPRNATAAYRIGQVYQTQDNCEPMKANYLKATSIDGNFMPAWRELFEVYGSKESACYNIDEAKKYLDKYTASSDPGIDLDKIRMKFCYYTNDYNCALSEIDKMFAKYGETDNNDLLLYKAYIYKDMNDSTNAKSAFEKYFLKETDVSKIGYRVYGRAAEIATKFPGGEAKAIEYYLKSIAAQPDAKLNVPTMSKLGELYDKIKDYNNSAMWYKKLIDAKETPTAGNYFFSTYEYYKAGDYTNGAAIANIYAEKFPTDYRGSFWAARNNAQLDSVQPLKGLAVPNYEKYISLAQGDSIKNKSGLVEATKYLFIYYLNTKKDKATAKLHLDKLKSIDPTNASIAELEGFLNGKVAPPPAPKPATPPVTTPKPGTTPVKTPATPVKPGTVAQKTPTNPVKTVAITPKTTDKPVVPKKTK